jgi:uncharacterized protein (TIGR03437 family)
MCRCATRPLWSWLAVLGLLSSIPALAQTDPAAPPPAPDWRKIGTTSVELLLAGPATGPVDAVWFSRDGRRLYARTRSGRVFESADFEHWTASAAVTPPVDPVTPVAVDRMPQPGSKIRQDASNAARLYALGDFLFRSDDGGRSWMNVSALPSSPQAAGGSVIGRGARDVAVSPRNGDDVVVANDYGVWRSVDGGLSWAGLNSGLPNLPVRRVLTAPGSGALLRILVDGLGEFEWIPAVGGAWQLSPAVASTAEIGQRRTLSIALKAEITAIAASGDYLYAGSADGRIWVSLDAGKTWVISRPAGGNGIDRLFVDSAQPRVALAALGGSGAHVLRTTNSGGFWDDLSANLPDVPAHGITADRTSGVVYVATDGGVFLTRADLENPGPPSAWTRIGGGIPDVAAVDVKLDASGNQLYVALDGYGIYAARAPHRSALRLVNAADFSQHPAAPGSLLSVVGGKINSARAGSLNFPVLAASDTESQIQVPFEIVGPAVSLDVQGEHGRFTFGLPVQNVAPAIFIGRDGLPMLLDADSGVLLEAGNSARSNSRIQILATGLGKVEPEWPTGMSAPIENVPKVTAKVQAYLDRVPVEVTKATLAPGYIGFYLIELQLPAIVNSGPAELYIAADGQESNRVRVYLEP